VKIVLVGSIGKNGKYMNELARQLTDRYQHHHEDLEVVYPGQWTNGKHIDDPVEIAKIRKQYLREIETSEGVIICNEADYVGLEASVEIGYSLAKKIPLWITHDTTVDSLAALLADGSAKRYSSKEDLRSDVLRKSLR
jgi:nucleoside 2-deoxyribosyltransferase